eukprot:TRINITY_DN19120_c0_g1_i1.p1 TRINITY_DN19120_c0_g1~~TRINITY_DN19120_c0_g1_i1.p1  ORF type:complete len:470 (+),score=74.92 TRINITY_DN19120_c0_g1_i1:259-1668(+)
MCLERMKTVFPSLPDMPQGDMEVHRCMHESLRMAHGVLAAVDGAIALVALVQFLRIHFYHNPQMKWTRQKVFHLMVFAANAGYAFYFLLTTWVSCSRWVCWHSVCAFSLLALPQIIFLATFLLLLSFWVDLCHQATDKEEEEDEEEVRGQGRPGIPEEAPLLSEEGRSQHNSYGWDSRSSLPSDSTLSLLRKPGEGKRSRGRVCCCVHVRGSRQKIVVGAVLAICLVTGAFAVLIWIGLGDNAIDPRTVAQVHADFFAVVMLLAGGGLAFYGLLLFSKMSRLRSGRKSAEISKVAWLAAVCLICFSFRAFLVLAKNLPVWGGVHFRNIDGNFFPVWVLLYYLVGEAVPSAVVLIILRGMPPASRSPEGTISSKHHGHSQQQQQQPLREPPDLPPEYTLLPPPPTAGLLEDDEEDPMLGSAEGEEADPALLMLPQWVVPPHGVPYPVMPSPPPSSLGTLREPRESPATPG